MEKIARGKRASENQKEYLFNFLEINVDIANDKFVTADGAKFRDAKWKELAVALNALGGTQKEGHKWKKYWSDLRVNTKAKYSAIRVEEQRSGINGLRRAKALSPLEEKIIQITTIEAVDGDNTPEVGFVERPPIINDVASSPASNVDETAWASMFACATTKSATTATTTASATTTVSTTAPSEHQATTTSGTTAAAPTARTKRAPRKRRAQESIDHVGDLFQIEEKKLKAMQEANELKREQLRLMQEQTAAIKADTDLKRDLCCKLQEVIEVFKGYFNFKHLLLFTTAV